MIFENLPSTNTPLNATNLNQTINLSGFIQMFAGSSAPTGWLMCDGSAVSRTTYADLYAVIGTTYGSGDGSTTFNLPDLRGRVGVGKSSDTEFDTLGETGGEKKHTLTTNELPSHSHVLDSYFGYVSTFNNIDANYGLSQGGAYADRVMGGNSNNTGRMATKTSGEGAAHNILQPYIVINYIIKT